jgi:uncharacterized protein (TIGR02145 family)
MKLKFNIVIILMMITSLAFVRCKEDDKEEQKIESPTISSLNPTSAAPGAVVKINGSNFSEVIAENVVKFNGTVAMVKSATKTQLSVEVPAQATTGKVVVTVSEKIVEGPEFKVIQTPTITGISPEKGFAGTVVEISCANFSDITGYKVLFNGKEARVKSATTSKITAEAPEGVTTGKVTISYDGKTIEGPTFTITTLPTISTISPTKYFAEGTVEIEGTNFSTTSGDHNVFFNGIEAEIEEVTSTKITVNVPSNAVTGKVTLTYSGKIIEGPTFTVIPLPIITSISPERGNQGSTIKVYGENFDTTPKSFLINIAGENAEIISVTSTEITIKAPCCGSGKVRMEYYNKTIEGPTFTMNPSPVISSVTPDYGDIGSVVTINGENFSTTNGDIKVYFNGVEASIQSITSTEISVKVPEGATTGLLSIKTKEGAERFGPEFLAFKDGKSTFTDTRDQKIYKVVKIGNQIWMAENLNYDVKDTYIDFCYEKNSANCSNYGRLYNYSTVKNVIPDGWHLPSDGEWKELEKYLGTDAGIKVGPNGTSGLNLSFGGYYYYEESIGLQNFSSLGYYGHYWVDSPEDESNSKMLKKSITSLTNNGDNKQIISTTLPLDDYHYFSVRCIRNQ